MNEVNGNRLCMSKHQALCHHGESAAAFKPGFRKAILNKLTFSRNVPGEEKQGQRKESCTLSHPEVESWQLDFFLVRLKCLASHPSNFFSLRGVGRRLLGFTLPPSV